ncbi:unnamed protein product [Dracunculus medinensis]|uniref:Protein YIPF n=1 Tax=Dracunculus medinensis TaxID=318479 RepID=A0A3P7QBB5_DRAME|nr:unnamed protein product [Dracunculus medinensis]
MDIQGPFWICVTLVFSTAICGNLAKYIEAVGDTRNYYGSDFRLVSAASTMIASYVLLVPFILYAFLWQRKVDIGYSYLELLCAYGYSLSIFVPVSILWVINSDWFRWLLIIISVALSGTVLVNSIWQVVKTDRNRMVNNFAYFFE